MCKIEKFQWRMKAIESGILTRTHPQEKGEAMGNYEPVFDLIGSILGGVIIGAFCGAISLIVGIIKKKKALGLIGFFVSIFLGIFMTTVLHQPAFLSIIPSAIFTGIIFILRKNQKKN